METCSIVIKFSLRRAKSAASPIYVKWSAGDAHRFLGCHRVIDPSLGSSHGFEHGALARGSSYALWADAVAASNDKAPGEGVVMLRKDLDRDYLSAIFMVLVHGTFLPSFCCLRHRSLAHQCKSPRPISPECSRRVTLGERQRTREKLAS
jgi:hypothetical protein